jgi:hypothetical protein
MTLNEQKRFAEKFMARRTSRIVAVQSGFNEQFAADPYNSGTLEETVDSSNGAPTDTTKGSDNDNNWNGTVPGGSNDDTDITGALDILQKHIESLGDKSLLDLWASTSDALKKTASGDFVQKAVANKGGSTESVRHVPDNTASQNAGSHGYIQTSELQKIESATERRLVELGSDHKLTARIVLNAGDKL